MRLLKSAAASKPEPMVPPAIGTPPTLIAKRVANERGAGSDDAHAAEVDGALSAGLGQTAQGQTADRSAFDPDDCVAHGECVVVTTERA